jgi:tetratricopeptide (TPR) repeat protein
VVWPVVRPGASTPDQAGGAGGAGGGGPAAGAAGVDLSSKTPREAADRLYTRVMGAAEVGDSATARGFVPMAMSAYEQARPLDADGLFHLSSLQRVAGDFAAALSTAGEALANEPDHLLNLYAAAEASRELGDADEARGYYQRLVDVWDEQMASGHLDYQAHATMMSSVRSAAVEFLAGGGA